MEVFELMTAAERKAIVEGFNQTQQDYSLERCFHELFEDQVARTPDRIALVFKEQRLTYSELNARANQLARYLRGQGLGRSVPVGLFLDRSADIIIALLGILKGGGAYVPLHPDLPKARLAHQLATTKAPILITRDSMTNRLPDYSGRVVSVDRDEASITCLPIVNPGKIATPDDLIYMIFTSGSTGVPKGVATRHQNVTNYTQFIIRKLGLLDPENSAGLSFANVSTLSADLGNTPIFAALASGGCLHMIADDVLLDGQLYAEQMSHEPLDVLKIAPSHLRALLASGDPARILPRKHLVIGGESLQWDFVHQIKQWGRCSILNHYSPTETTIGCLTFEVEADNPLAETTRVVPLGRPIGNMKVYILDSNLSPVPVGVPGDLYIGGAGVSNGYVGQPELTASRFIVDPLNPASGQLFYRSGDRTRFLNGGIVEFLGREDDQVKIRGFRVELGEIETVLSRHPDVSQAAVVYKQSPAGHGVLAGFVVGEKEIEGHELREFLRRYLPDYMVPSSFIFAKSFPLNANGKIDRQALAATLPEAARHESLTPELDPTQEKLIRIWSDLLGRSVGLHDNFFELGGHSLLATQIIARVRSAFDAPVPLRCIFEAPTVAGLAEAITQYQQVSSPDEDLERILREVEGLSDEEARRLLETEK